MRSAVPIQRADIPQFGGEAPEDLVLPHLVLTRLLEEIEGGERDR